MGESEQNLQARRRDVTPHDHFAVIFNSREVEKKLLGALGSEANDGIPKTNKNTKHHRNKQTL